MTGTVCPPGRRGQGPQVQARFERDAGEDRVTYKDPDDRQMWIEVFRDDSPSNSVRAPRDWAQRDRWPVVQRNLVVGDGDGGMYQLRVSVPGAEDAEIDGHGLFAAAEDDFE